MRFTPLITAICAFLDTSLAAPVEDQEKSSIPNSFEKGWCRAGLNYCTDTLKSIGDYALTTLGTS